MFFFYQILLSDGFEDRTRFTVKIHSKNVEMKTLKIL